MKRYMFFCVFAFVTFAQSNAHTITVDSIKVFKQDDTTWCLGIYGAYILCPAFIMDTTKDISGDSIKISVCYNNGGSSGDFCITNDTFYLGNLHSSNYFVSVAISQGYSVPFKCVNNTWRDTFQFSYITTGLDEVQGNNRNSLIYPNPVLSRLSFKLDAQMKNSTAQILSVDGKIIMTRTPVKEDVFETEVSSLAPGLYFLVLQNQQYRWIEKFEA